MDRKKPCKVGENKSDIVADVPLACADETAAVEFMERRRWGDTPCCPMCGDVEVYKMMDKKTGQRNKDYRWRCRGVKCGKVFSVRVGTVLADSRIPMRYWCRAFWRACSSKKGISAMQLQRETGLSYKSALFLLHRVRFAMADMDGVKLTGTVECDETYVGGKPRFPGVSKRGRGTNKQPVFAMVERNGKVRTKVVADVTAATLKGAIRENVDCTARIITDDNRAYIGIGNEFEGGHETVTHSAKEYVRKGTDIHSNTIEGFFSLLKRGVYGTFHNVSKKHLHRYCEEFAFRYNNRSIDDGARTEAAIKGAIGKRLMYREPLTA